MRDEAEELAQLRRPLSSHPRTHRLPVRCCLREIYSGDSADCTGMYAIACRRLQSPGAVQSPPFPQCHHSRSIPITLAMTAISIMPALAARCLTASLDALTRALTSSASTTLTTGQ